MELTSRVRGLTEASINHCEATDQTAGHAIIFLRSECQSNWRINWHIEMMLVGGSGQIRTTSKSSNCNESAKRAIFIRPTSQPAAHNHCAPHCHCLFWIRVCSDFILQSIRKMCFVLLTVVRDDCRRWADYSQINRSEIQTKRLVRHSVTLTWHTPSLALSLSLSPSRAMSVQSHSFTVEKIPQKRIKVKWFFQFFFSFSIDAMQGSAREI